MKLIKEILWIRMVEIYLYLVQMYSYYQLNTQVSAIWLCMIYINVNVVIKICINIMHHVDTYVGI